jgi:hypothetical protein
MSSLSKLHTQIYPLSMTQAGMCNQVAVSPPERLYLIFHIKLHDKRHIRLKAMLDYFSIQKRVILN